MGDDYQGVCKGSRAFPNKVVRGIVAELGFLSPYFLMSMEMGKTWSWREQRLVAKESEHWAWKLERQNLFGENLKNSKGE